jgi:hypothetical protein
MMLMMIKETLFGQLGLLVPSSGVRDVFRSIAYVFIRSCYASCRLMVLETQQAVYVNSSDGRMMVGKEAHGGASDVIIRCACFRV